MGVELGDWYVGGDFLNLFFSGTRCLSGNNLRTDGSTVNDSHAEVLARRGFLRFAFAYNKLIFNFLRFIYAQLNDFLDNKETIFDTKRADDNRLVLRPNVHIHLFINTAPCGDGRVFTMAYVI
jgi:hypothetical protein